MFGAGKKFRNQLVERKKRTLKFHEATEYGFLHFLGELSSDIQVMCIQEDQMIREQLNILFYAEQI